MTLPVLSRPREVAGWDPFRELDDLHERKNALWAAGLGNRLERWAPLADVEETDDAWSVDIDVPGVRREDIDIQLVDRQLTVSGELKEKERVGILRRRTRPVGRFQYSVTLPGELDPDNVSARLHDGVLSVRVPKAAKTRPRRIEITAG